MDHDRLSPVRWVRYTHRQNAAGTWDRRWWYKNLGFNRLHLWWIRRNLEKLSKRQPVPGVYDQLDGDFVYNEATAYRELKAWLHAPQPPAQRDLAD